MAETKSSLQKQYARQNRYIEDKYDRVSVVLPKGTKEQIKALGFSVNKFIASAVMEKLNGSSAETHIEEPKPVEDTAAVEEVHEKSPYEEMISRRNGDQTEHKPKTPEQIMKELEAVNDINAHPGKFHAGMTMEEYERMKGAEMPPSATEAHKNKDDLTFVGGSL